MIIYTAAAAASSFHHNMTRRQQQELIRRPELYASDFALGLIFCAIMLYLLYLWVVEAIEAQHVARPPPHNSVYVSIPDAREACGVVRLLKAQGLLARAPSWNGGTTQQTYRRISQSHSFIVIVPGGIDTDSTATAAAAKDGSGAFSAQSYHELCAAITLGRRVYVISPLRLYVMKLRYPDYVNLMHPSIHHYYRIDEVIADICNQCEAEQ